LDEQHSILMHTIALLAHSHRGYPASTRGQLLRSSRCSVVAMHSSSAFFGLLAFCEVALGWKMGEDGHRYVCMCILLAPLCALFGLGRVAGWLFVARCDTLLFGGSILVQRLAA